MTTTAVFAEVLIIGVISTTWIVLAAVGLGLRADQLAVVKGWEALATVAFLAVAYCLGVVVDRLADYLQDALTKTMWADHRPSTESPSLGESEARLRVMGLAPDGVIAFLDYARSRRRIARAVVLAATLVAVTSVADLALNSHLRRFAVALTVTALGGLVMAALSFWAWRDIGLMYHRRLRQAYRIFVLKQSEPIADIVEPSHR